VITLGGPVIATFLGNGNGTLRNGPFTNIGWSATLSGAAMDLNGDGVVDLVIDR